MPTTPRKPVFFLSAAEPSADIHCAHLIEHIRKLRPDARFVGIGGEEMARAGCELLANTVDRAAMIYNAFGQIGFFRKVLAQVKSYLAANPADLVIVCDSPALNFHVSKIARKQNIRTLFYVAPQLWAWGGWRMSKLRKRCDKLCCILPFESKWFASRGMDAEFVGNPLMAGLDMGPRSVKTFEDMSRPRIALLPGSRSAELKTLWPPMQQIAMRIREQVPGARFTAVAVNPAVREQLEAARLDSFDVDYSIRDVYDTAIRSDFALVASGSATLQVAAAGCPMVVMYQSSRLLWHLLGRWLVRIRNLSLVNILAQRRVVPEFMPYFTSIEPIAEACIDLLSEPVRMGSLSRELIEITEPLVANDASASVARIATAMVAQP